MKYIIIPTRSKLNDVARLADLSALHKVSSSTARTVAGCGDGSGNRSRCQDLSRRRKPPPYRLQQFLFKCSKNNFIIPKNLILTTITLIKFKGLSVVAQ